MPSELLGTEVRVGIEMKIITMTILEVEVDLPQAEVRSLAPDLIPGVSTNCDRVRCYKCLEYDHFASECPNTPTDEETDYEEAEPASLQIMTQNYCPIDSGGEAEYLNL